jgi:hypothetical protein
MNNLEEWIATRSAAPRAIKLPIFLFHFVAIHPMMRNDMFITMNNLHTSKPKLRWLALEKSIER